jgi:ATP-dependent RNA helicase RhlE
MTFNELKIIDPILKALEAEGYIQPTPIQEQSIPILLDGKDLLGCAQTGTGKTAAFAIPILQHLYLNRQQNSGPRSIKALIITPTRELALQIAESFSTYGKYTGIKNTVIFGGVKQGAQTQALQRGIDVLVATPGRLLDLMGQGFVSLKSIEYFVLDEADHMLDMGFIHDIRKIIAKLPLKRQSLFFSATMPPEIIRLSQSILGKPEKVSIRPEQATAEKVGQAVYFVDKKSKPKLLTHLLKTSSLDSVLVFSRTKHGADKIVKMLGKSGINSEAIHGNKSQGARQRALGNFKSGDLRVLVATDIAARGIDVEEISHVINYDLPNVPETYIHRIGRTGRASASGIAISFCDAEEKTFLNDIQKLIDQKIPVVAEHPFLHDSGGDTTHTAPNQVRNPNQGQAINRGPRPGKASQTKRHKYYSGNRY